MLGSGKLGCFWRWVAWWVVVGGGLARGEGLVTVAYVVDQRSFEQISAGRMGALPEGFDPFGSDERSEGDLKFTESVPLAEKPKGTRFCRDGDRMWLLTGHLREGGILEDRHGWAVWS